VTADLSVTIGETPSGEGNPLSNVTLVWDAPDGDPTSCVGDAGSAPGLSNIAVYDSGSADTTFFVAGVPPGTYYVRIRARNAAGISEPSNEIVVRIDGNPTTGVSSCPTLNPPIGLTSTITGSAVRLGWTASAGATSYRIEAGSVPGASDLFNGDVGNLATLEAIVSPGDYWVRVRANSVCRTSAPSREIAIRVSLPR
jgi:hypothetical protein